MGGSGGADAIFSQTDSWTSGVLTRIQPPPRLQDPETPLTRRPVFTPSSEPSEVSQRLQEGLGEAGADKTASSPWRQTGGGEQTVPSPAGVRRRGQVGGVIRRAVHLRRRAVKETQTISCGVPFLRWREARSHRQSSAMDIAATTRKSVNKKLKRIFYTINTPRCCCDPQQAAVNG